MGVLNKRYLFVHSSGGHKSKIKELSGVVSSENLLLGLQTFSLCPHMTIFLWARGRRERERESELGCHFLFF